MTPHINVSLGTHLIRQIVYTHNQLQTSPYPAHTHTNTLTPRPKSSPISNTKRGGGNNREFEFIRKSFNAPRLFLRHLRIPNARKGVRCQRRWRQPRPFLPSSLLAALLWLALLSVVLFKIENANDTKHKMKMQNEIQRENRKRKTETFLDCNGRAPSPLCSSAFLDVNWKRDAACTCRQPQGVCSSSVCVSVCIAHAASK